MRLAERPGRILDACMAMSLLVLAAGLGSRYGGLKQLDPVGPSGETLLDYAVFDAVRAGFGCVVFVIRREIAVEFRDKIGARYTGLVAVDYIFQTLDELPPGFKPSTGREKPWGTGHAVWCAREVLRENFAVINADDFYGAEALQKLGKFLKESQVSDLYRGKADIRQSQMRPAQMLPGRRPAAEFALAGYRLANTLSEYGAVSRGVCEVGADGALGSITEQTNLSPADVGAGRKFSGHEIVSMNCWGFTPALFPALDAQLTEFLQAHGRQTKTEFYLPAAVSLMISRGEAHGRVLPTAAAWFGVTYREDKPRVQAALAELVRRGEYPKKLF
jgi:hypothetical protein